MGRFGSQEAWAAGDRNDFEEQNEDGGDINDEPHDPEEDKGAEEDEGYPGAVEFSGEHYYRPRFRLGDHWGQS